jgi:regulator of sigma E protease
MEKQAYEQEDGQIVYLYGLYFGFEEKSVGTVLKNAWYTALDFARMVWLSLADLVKGFVRVDDMSGPVGIVSVIAETGKSSETAAVAALNIAYLGAFIAVNLAVMNLLPVPALDGGRIFFLVITWILEKIIRRKIDPKYEGYIHAAGMVLLLSFIAFITFKDIWKLFV